MIDTVYLDMDGCFCDWVTPMLAHDVMKNANITTVEQLNKCKHRNELIGAVYHDQPNFFLTLPRIDKFLEVVEFVVDNFRCFEILTADGGVHHSPEIVEQDKKAFIDQYFKDHFGGWIPVVHVVKTHHNKTTFANSKTLLVDDYDKNILNWRRSGGYGVLFNQDNHIHEVINELKMFTN